MAPIIVIGHLTTSGKAARQLVIDGLTKVMNYARESEPGVTKYAITIPQKADDEQSLYVIEEYADQAALDAHMASPAVAGMGALFSSDPSLLQGAPTVHQLQPDAAFTRPTISDHASPYIVFATLNYKPGTRDTAIEGFAQVCKVSEKPEPGTLSYNILSNKSELDIIRTVEVYESESYLWDVHAKSDAVQGNGAATKDMRTNLELVFLKMVGGYFHR